MSPNDANWIDPNPPAPVDPRSSRIVVLSGAALTAVVLVALVVVVFAAHRGVFDDGGDRPHAELVAVNAADKDPFMPSVVTMPTQVSSSAASQVSNLMAQLPTSSRGVRLVAGTQPGLYGALPQGAACDVPAVANQLDAQPAKGRLWSQVLGIDVNMVPYYLNSLTPVTLNADTWVTTHSYTDGRASAIQAVLQAGSAVLIDRAGVPRVHCASGAPLLPPANASLATMSLDGKRWLGFDVQNVVAIGYGVANSRAIDEFNLLDLATGDTVAQKAGGLIALNSSVPLPDPVAMNVPPMFESTAR